MNKINFCGSALIVALTSGCGTTAQTVSTAPRPVAAPSAMAAPARPAPAMKAGSKFDKPGFFTTVVKGRLWVFEEGSEELAAYAASGKTPAVHVTRVKAGPEGMTIIAPEGETIVQYMVMKPGFHTVVKDGRLWVFEEGSEALAAYKASGKTPAVHSTRVKAGPLGMTIIAPEGETIVDYMTTKPGFHTVVKDGRLWVFEEGSEALAAYKASGKTPAVHATRIKAGPLGMTIIAPDLAVLDAYMQ